MSSLIHRIAAMFSNSRNDLRRKKSVRQSTIESLETRMLLTLNVVANMSNSPSRFTEVNGTVFFTASLDQHGLELWKTDGTAAGTVLVKDIRIGSGGANPSALTNVNGTLFFAANDGVNGYELWKSDGSETGTVLVRDISSGSGGAYPIKLTNVNGTLFFRAFDGVNGNELWKSDGTTAGTALVKNIGTGGASSSVDYLTNANGTLYFRADNGVNGVELWKSDGTSVGTTMVKDIRITGSASPYHLTNVNGTLYFRAALDAVNGHQLWKSNGTEAGTVKVKDINTSGDTDFDSLTSVNDTLYFVANDGSHGRELWKSDGTSSGTVLVKDIQSGISSANPGYLTNVNGVLYFRANDGVNGDELWKSDGTSDGTLQVKDIRTGGSSASLRYLTNVNGVLYFRANDGVNGDELWKSNGTAAGTQLVANIGLGPAGSNPSNFTVAGGQLYFTSTNQFGERLYRYFENSPPTSIGLTNNSLPENAGLNAVIGTVSGTDPDPGGTLTFSLPAGIGNNDLFNISGTSLRANSSFDFESISNYIVTVRATDPLGLALDKSFAILVTDVDELRPTSRVTAFATGAVATSLQIPVIVTGTDFGAVSGGVKEFDIFVAQDSGSWIKFATVPAVNGNATAVFPASSNHTYVFYSIARDYAENVELKPQVQEALIRVNDLDKPQTRVWTFGYKGPAGTAGTAADDGSLWTVQSEGVDLGGSKLIQVDLYCSIDDGPYEYIGSDTTGFPSNVSNSSGNNPARDAGVRIPWKHDGLSHTYRFYSLGRDSAGNVEDAPAQPDQLITVAFSIRSQTMPNSIDVQGGVAQRSYITTVDVAFPNASDLTAYVNANGTLKNNVGIRRYATDVNSANFADPGIDVSGVTATVVDRSNGGKILRLNFIGTSTAARLTDLSTSLTGAQKIAAMRAGDGVYRIFFDTDGGGFTGAADKALGFHRLLGDANGDKVVGTDDGRLIDFFSGNYSSMNLLLDGDLNGDKKVDTADKQLTTAFYGALYNSTIAATDLFRRLRSSLFAYLND